MLKHSMFSDHYLNYRNNSTDKSCAGTKFEGSLAVLPKRQQEDKRVVLCRRSSKTWWESGWQFNR
jgi:hypothetical protein